MAETPERIEDHSIIEEMQDSYLTYAMSVITARALPDGRDGLKPSQRRILVAMNDLNLGPRSQHRKCAKIAGDTAGNYHPHGDQVIYPTLVRMAQAWNMRQTLVDGQGNFGSMDGDAPAAMRYTEARLTADSIDMLADLEFETVDFEPNYDGTRTEPVVLPSKFPNLLVNGTTARKSVIRRRCRPPMLHSRCVELKCVHQMGHDAIVGTGRRTTRLELIGLVPDRRVPAPFQHSRNKLMHSRIRHDAVGCADEGLDGVSRRIEKRVVVVKTERIIVGRSASVQLASGHCRQHLLTLLAEHLIQDGERRFVEFGPKVRSCDPKRLDLVEPEADLATIAIP